MDDNENEGVDTVEIDAGQWVTIAYSRRWPKYIAEWSVRQEVSKESHFPLFTGTVERMPPPDGTSLEAVRSELREEAVAQANAALAAAPAAPPKKTGLLGRLFGRN